MPLTPRERYWLIAGFLLGVYATRAARVIAWAWNPPPHCAPSEDRP